MKNIFTKSLILGVSIFASNSALATDAGQSTYERACSVCHSNGIAGAPKFADIDAWTPLIEKGKEALYESALNGKGSMPAKGGQTGLSDEDVKAAVDFLIKNATNL